MKTAIVTLGLGFGDEGKGATVDYLCRALGADLVVRYCGGSQAAHNVRLPDGRHHVFSQFGAGTLAGVPTYVGPRVIINPSALVREAAHLEELGVDDPYATLQVHPDALVSTYFHQGLNRLRERARGVERHGSCGQGIGESRNYWLKHGGDAIRAGDLGDAEILRAKVELLRQRALLDLQGFVDRVAPEDEDLADFWTVTGEAVADHLLEIGEVIRIAREPPEFNLAVFEGAQGVLLDEWRGFHPHTTWSTVTAQPALELALRAKVERVRTLGVGRIFTTRHGAGPLPTFDAGLTERLDDPGNPVNPWQGALRVGWLDLVLLHYGAKAAGTLDGLAVTWLDHGDRARVCTHYEGHPAILPPELPNLGRQEALNRVLELAVPIFRDVARSGLLDLFREVAPIVVEAHGPTHLDRTIARGEVLGALGPPAFRSDG